MTDQIKTVLSGAVSKVFLNTGLRRMPSSANATIPWQHLLPTELASAIDNGMTLIEFCNHTSYGTRLVEVEFLTSDVMKAYIPYAKLAPFSPRAIHSKWEGVNYKDIKGDKARGVAFETIWNLASHPCMHPDEQALNCTPVRFDLTTALFTLRNVALVPKKPHIDEFFFLKVQKTPWELV